MRQAPGTVLAHEPVAGDQGAAVELFLADHQRGIAVEEHPLVIAGDPRRIRIAEGVAPAFHHRVAVGERRPAGMNAGDRRSACPKRVHRRDIAGREGAIEFEICEKHGIAVVHRRLRFARSA
jgi:hypothetical protein